MGKTVESENFKNISSVLIDVEQNFRGIVTEILSNVNKISNLSQLTHQVSKSVVIRCQL